MKITKLDLQAEGKRYKCGNRIFKVKGGNLIDVERNTYLGIENMTIAELLEMDFEEIKETKNPYERVDNGELYYIVNQRGGVGNFKDLNDHTDDKLFNSFNYFNNKNYAEYIAFKESLMRRMDRFAWENNARVIDWDKNVANYCIIFDNHNKDVEIMVAYALQSNDIYFTSQEIAEMALEKFKDDLIKLYTWEFDV